MTDITLKAGETFIFFSYFTWGYILYIVLFIPLLFIVKRLKKRVIEPENLFGLFSVLAFVFYLFLATMHERYLYPLFPLLAVYVGFRRQFLWVFIVATIVHSLNVIAAWQPIAFPEQIVLFLTNRYVSWLSSFVLLFVSPEMYFTGLHLSSVS